MKFFGKKETEYEVFVSYSYVEEGVFKNGWQILSIRGTIDSVEKIVDVTRAIADIQTSFENIVVLNWKVLKEKEKE